MADATVLKNSAIVRNASVGNTKPPQVNVGALPNVQMKAPPGGPQVQTGQQKPVTILPPRDANGAVIAGALPMVHVKMTQNGPQIDDGRDHPVVIRDGKPSVSAGGLPMLQVQMTESGPQVQNMPQVQVAPPQIPTAPPVVSRPRAAHAGSLPQATHVRNAAPQMVSTPAAMSHPRVARIAAPRPVLPEVPEFAVEQLMLCQHLAEKYLGELRAAVPAAEGAEPAVDTTAAANLKLVEETITTIEQALIAVAVRAEAAANAAAAPPAPAPVAFGAYVAPRPLTGGHVAPASAAPIARTAPAVSYVQPRSGVRPHAAGARMQGAASLAPRGVSRGGPLPMVQVKMDGGRPIVQNKAAIDQAREDLALAQAQAQAQAQVQTQAAFDQVEAPTPAPIGDGSQG